MKLVIAAALLGAFAVPASADNGERTFDSLKPVSQEPALYRAEVVDKPVLALAPKIGACGTLKGKGIPALKVGIAPDGTVSTVSITGANGLTPELIECVDKLVRTATFPARPKSKGTTVSFAMVYRPLRA